MIAFGKNEYCMIFVTVIDSSKNKKVYYKKQDSLTVRCLVHVLLHCWWKIVSSHSNCTKAPRNLGILTISSHQQTSLRLFKFKIWIILFLHGSQGTFQFSGKVGIRFSFYRKVFKLLFLRVLFFPQEGFQEGF